MNDKELEERKARAATETLVIAPTDGGFRVYNPANITHLYMVTGIPELPKCNCPDFENHQTDPDWRCKHILAVLSQLEKPLASGKTENPEPAKETNPAPRTAEPPENKKMKTTRTSQHPQMVIKRSVSPDGRIDSLSVEFATAIDGATEKEIKDRAAKVLNLQAEIVQTFLCHNGKRKPEGPSQENHTGNNAQRDANNTPPAKNSDGAVPAQLLNVAGMNTRSGWRFFINVQVNGATVKLFGSKRELAEYVVAAGFTNIAERLEQGMTLNLPCRVFTKPSPDGRYVNIERVLPAKPLEEKGRNGQ